MAKNPHLKTMTLPQLVGFHKQANGSQQDYIEQEMRCRLDQDPIPDKIKQAIRKFLENPAIEWEELVKMM